MLNIEATLSELNNLMGEWGTIALIVFIVITPVLFLIFRKKSKPNSGIRVGKNASFIASDGSEIRIKTGASSGDSNIDIRGKVETDISGKSKLELETGNSQSGQKGEDL